MKNIFETLEDNYILFEKVKIIVIIDNSKIIPSRYNRERLLHILEVHTSTKYACDTTGRS